MKNLFSILALGILCISVPNFLLAQKYWEDKAKNPTNLNSLWEQFKIQYPEYNKPEQDSKDEKGEKEDGSNLFIRQYQYLAPRVYPSMKAFDPEAAFNAYIKYTSKQRNYKKSSYEADWKYSGSKTLSEGYNAGIGRCNYFVMNPKSPNTMYIGTPTGGIWKSTNGINFSLLNDSLPVLSSCDMVINPRYPDSIFVASGDGYGYSIGNGDFWGGNYSLGVMVSGDGGKTFQKTGLNFTTTQSRQIFKLIMNPLNPNSLYASANNGIWMSKNAGVSWVKSGSGTTFRDIKMHPTDTSIIYIAGGQFAASYDAGKTWKNSTLPNGLSSNNSNIAVTKSGPHHVYLTSTTGLLLKSSDSGKTWTQKFGNIGLSAAANWYYNPLVVSPFDTNFIIGGSINLYKSTNNGNYFSQFTGSEPGFSPSYCHPDHRNIVFSTTSNDTLYSVSDGGVHITTDRGQTWNYIGQEIRAHMVYRLSGDVSSPDYFFYGLQDNGVNRNLNGTFSHVLRGDGMSAALNWDDNKRALTTTQYGALYVTSDMGNNWYYNQQPETGNWTTPIAYSYINPKVAFFGGSKLYRSTNYGFGGTWKSLNGKLPSVSNNNIHRIALSAKSDSVIYFTRGNENFNAQPIAYATKDMGKNWVIISKNLPVASVFLSDLTCDKYNDDTLFATFSGYVDSQKVYSSYDGGKTWKNITGSLPNVPINCVELEYSALHGVYIGTDIGVFYKNDDLSDWTYYLKGMPATIISDLQVYAFQGIVRASTFGAGIFDAKLAETPVGIEIERSIKINVAIFPNPSQSGIFNVIIPESSFGKASISIYDLKGSLISSMNNVSSGKTMLDISNAPKGNYIANISIGKYLVSKKLIVQ